jgi:circadian clock protein KaiB
VRGGGAIVQLRLYVAGSNLLSQRALENLRAILDRTPPGSYGLEVVDLVAEPERADEHRILATPTLVRLSPAPLRKVIGDLSDTAGVRRHLGIAPDPATSEQGTD